ncbi:MAG: hypothetical protein E6713_08040 [Sporomusaceae bacterium]|nr:hypothetical protein [Sporomusaceae bacterium]
MHITFDEYIYYGLLITILSLYLRLYVKNRHEIKKDKKAISRWGIVCSFAVIGIMGFFFHLIAWPAALLSSVAACAIAYYVIFIKYPV